jgi:hypothetical protein
LNDTWYRGFGNNLCLSSDQTWDTAGWITAHRKFNWHAQHLWPAAQFKPRYKGRLLKIEDHKLATRLTDVMTDRTVITVLGVLSHL